MLAFALFAPFAVQAETFKCSFTEPFVDFTYSTTTQKLIMNDPVVKSIKVLRRVTFEILGPAEFVLKSSTGIEVARLTLTGKGSDGMGETIYPYSVYTSLIGKGAANSGIGGCSSTKLPVKPGQP